MFKIKENKFFYQIIKANYQFGIWSYKGESYLGEMTRKLFFLLYFIMFQTLLVGCAFLSDDKDGFIFFMSIEFFVFVITIKLIHLLWKKEEILSFVNDDIMAHKTVEGDEMVPVMKKLKKCIICVRIYFVILGATFLLCISAPLFLSEKQLPLFIVFTLSWKCAELIYWMLYIFIIFGIILGCVAHSITLIILYVMYNYAIEYQVLASQLSNLGVKKTENSLSVERDLIRLIKIHCNLFEY